MFIKRGDDIKNKIVAVIDGDELTEEQKKSAQEITKKVTTKQTDTSDMKKSGR